MLQGQALIGAITIYRQEVRPFTDKQIELVQNFAAQAVIAIENTRLLNELRQRTDDLTESLEQQTATSEVLKVISSSPGDLEPVFHAILANATRICGAKFGNLVLHENGVYRDAALFGAPPAFAALRARNSVVPAGPHSTARPGDPDRAPAAYRGCRRRPNLHCAARAGTRAISLRWPAPGPCWSCQC